jgi:hypothetical protein
VTKRFNWPGALCFLVGTAAICLSCERNEGGEAPQGPAAPAETSTGGQAAPGPAETEAPGGDVQFVGLAATLPDEWVRETPDSAMRAVQARVPGAGGAGDAQLVVFFLGEGMGGTAEANIVRWAGQFSGPAGEPVEPIVTTDEYGGMAGTVVELAGTYAPGAMGGGGGPEPGQRMIQAMIDAPRGKVFVRLLGPDATVAANRERFLAMLETLRGS